MAKGDDLQERLINFAVRIRGTNFPCHAERGFFRAKHLFAATRRDASSQTAPQHDKVPARFRVPK
jgi:hypothetical protein